MYVLTGLVLPYAVVILQSSKVYITRDRKCVQAFKKKKKEEEEEENAYIPFLNRYYISLNVSQKVK